MYIKVVQKILFFYFLKSHPFLFDEKEPSSGQLHFNLNRQCNFNFQNSSPMKYVIFQRK